MLPKAAAALCFLCFPARSVSGQEFPRKQWRVMDLTLLQLWAAEAHCQGPVCWEGMCKWGLQAPVPGKCAAFPWCIPCRQGYSPVGDPFLTLGCGGLLVFPGSSPWLSAQGTQCQVRASPPGSPKARSGLIGSISPCVAEQLCGQLAVKEGAVN